MISCIKSATDVNKEVVTMCCAKHFSLNKIITQVWHSTKTIAPYNHAFHKSEMIRHILPRPGSPFPQTPFPRRAVGLAPAQGGRGPIYYPTAITKPNPKPYQPFGLVRRFAFRRGILQVIPLDAEQSARPPFG